MYEIALLKGTLPKTNFSAGFFGENFSEPVDYLPEAHLEPSRASVMELFLRKYENS